MWTYIKKEDYDSFISQYSMFETFSDDLILLESEDAYFLPRLFVQNFPSKYIHIFDGKQEEYQPLKIEGIEFTGELRKEQVNIINVLAKSYKDKGYLNGIVKARPGLG